MSLKTQGLPLSMHSIIYWTAEREKKKQWSSLHRNYATLELQGEILGLTADAEWYHPRNTAPQIWSNLLALTYCIIMHWLIAG